MNRFQEIIGKMVECNTAIVNASLEEMIQPYTELPASVYDDENNDRIGAHELFSCYTVNVMRAEIIYAR